jgi:hypothetical protein
MFYSIGFLKFLISLWKEFRVNFFNIWKIGVYLKQEAWKVQCIFIFNYLFMHMQTIYAHLQHEIPNLNL